MPNRRRDVEDFWFGIASILGCLCFVLFTLLVVHW